MKNVIFIIADSMSFDRIHSKNGVGEMTPFLNSIEDECVIAEGLYSQGPYTEAGTKGLLCSCDTLDNGGYFLRYDSQKQFITDYFKELGFETYNINSPWYLLSKRTIDNIDHNYYTSGFDCRFLWSQRFSFYYDKWYNQKFDDEDYDYLACFVELVFETAEDFFHDNGGEKYKLIDEYIDYNVLNTNYKLLLEEKQLFFQDRKEYIDSVFKLKMEHPVFRIKNINLDKMINTSLVNKTINNNKAFIRKFKRIQFYNNLIYNHCPKGTIKNFLARTIRNKRFAADDYGEIKNRIRNLVSGREIKVYRTGRYYTNDPYKLGPSAKTLIEFAVSLIDNSNRDKFIFIHPEEPHYFNTFFSYDSKNIELLDEEFKYADRYLDLIAKDYRGSLYYDLSVRYIDKQIEHLYKVLKETNKIKDTLVVLTADHGSSYFFDPIRKKLVNNMHSENYHIPLYIFGGGVEGKRINSLASNKDVIPTVVSLCGKSPTKNMKGHSMMDDNYCNDAIMIEYMGPGCPDIRLRPVWLSARSNNYSVCFISALDEAFDENNINEIYDLVNDPQELKNISYQRNTEIYRLIEHIKSRFEKLKTEQGQY